MRLKFSIHYGVLWGQTLHVLITYRYRDGGERTENHLMTPQGGDCWMLETTLPDGARQPYASFSYYYQVENGEGSVERREWRGAERAYVFDASVHYVFSDSWQESPSARILFTSAFSVWRQQWREDKAEGDDVLGQIRLPMFRRTILFRVFAPQLADNEELAICGNHPVLGDWNPSCAVRMRRMGAQEWAMTVRIDNVALPLEYKYVVIDRQSRRLKQWEEGDNRSTGNCLLADGEALVLFGHLVRLPEKRWHGAGVSVLLSELRSERSCGIGDFGDLRRLVDWAISVGMRMVHLPPLHDTVLKGDCRDNNPYHSVSSCALHPQYLDLVALGEIADKDAMRRFCEKRKELEALGEIDDEAVCRVKSDYACWRFEEEGEAVLSSQAFKEFQHKNAFWLIPYAVFCVKRKELTAGCASERAEWGVYCEKILEGTERLVPSLEREIHKIEYVQYHLHWQLKSVSDYARSHGVVLMTDVPVGVCPDSVDRWLYSDLFDDAVSLGQMPSDEIPDGRISALMLFKKPLTEQQQAGITAWWHGRMERMAEFFDAIRLPQAISYVSAWVVPHHQVSATMGQFSPSLPLTVEELAMFGLKWPRDMYARPWIDDAMVAQLFGLCAEKVKRQYLLPSSNGFYRLRDEVASPARLQHVFEGRTDESSLYVKEGLRRLAANVLFVEDAHRSGEFHPRLGGLHTSAFRMLNEEERRAYHRVYRHYFGNRHEALWRCCANRFLAEAAGSTRMLVVASDDGAQPYGWGEALAAHGVLPFSVSASSKSGDAEFGQPEKTPYRSMVAASELGSASLQQWWEECLPRAQRYAMSVLQKEMFAPCSLSPALAEEIVARHLHSPSMFCVLNMQDWLAVSGTSYAEGTRTEGMGRTLGEDNRWRNRMPFTLNQLQGDDAFNEKIRQMIKGSGR